MKIYYFCIFLMFLLPLAAENHQLKKYNGDPLKTWHYTLENGLQVFLTENHEKPVLYTEVVVRAGSSSDPQTSTGIAHYLEHMLFKGTDRFGTVDYGKEKVHLDKITELYEKHFNSQNEEERKAIMAEISKASQLASKFAIPNEFDRMYQKMGSVGVNAHTSNEETVYKVQCPSNSLKKWCLIESERFRDPVFRLFQTEIEAVYEEKNGSLDSKDSALYEAFLKLAYKNHPYGQQTTLGSVEHLKSPSIKRMYEFYKNYYVPNNMAIIISGDINPPEAIKLISRYFSSWKSKKVPTKKTWDEKAFSGEESVEVNFPGEEQLMMAFRIPIEGHEDEYALKFIDMILDNSQAGLINVNLNQALKVKRAGCYPMFLNDYAVHSFYGIPKKGQSLEDVKKLILEQIGKVKKGEFEEWLLTAILADFAKSEQSGYEKNQGRVATLRDLFISGKSIDRLTADTKKFAKVSKEDIVRVANKYYGNDFAIAYRRDKKAEKIKMTKPQFEKVKVDPDRESLFSKRVGMTSVAGLKPVYVDFQKDFSKKVIADGLSLYATNNPINNLFSLTLKIPIGKYHEPLLPLLASLFNEGGWSKRSPEEVSNGFYKKAASYSMSVGNNETLISLAGLDESLVGTYKMLHELMINFEASPERIKTQVEIILDDREKQKKEAGYLSYALANYSRYKAASPFLTVINPDSLSASTPKKLRVLLDKLLKSEKLVNYVGGEEIAEVGELLQGLGKIGSVEKPEKMKLKALTYDAPEINFLNFDTIQTHIRMEFPGDIYNIEEESLYMLFNEYFDGSLGSVVFQEIRETRALAYSAWSRFLPRGEKGLQNLMICSLTTQADKTLEAMKVFHDIVFKFPFSQDRFEVAKGALITQLKTKRLSFRVRLATIQSWEELDVTDKDPNQMYLAQIEKLTLADLKRFVETKIYGKKFVISIVGDKKRIDLEKLKAFGKVTEVELDDIFVK